MPFPYEPDFMGDRLFTDFEPLVELYGDPDDALLTQCRGLGRMMQPLHDLVSDGPNGEPGYSQLFDLDRAKAEWLPWIGQMVGYVVPNYDTSNTALVDRERERIVTRSAHRRGAIPILREVVQEHLNAPKDVFIVERNGSSRRVDVYVYTSQIATSLAEITAAARTQKAARVIMTVTGIAAGTWDQLVAAQGTWNTVTTKFASWNEVASNPTKP